MDNDTPPEFKQQTIARLLQTLVLDEKENVKVSRNTIRLVNEYLKIFTTEAVLRSNEHRLATVARREQDREVLGDGSGSSAAVAEEEVLDVDDLEAVSGLLVLDF